MSKSLLQAVVEKHGPDKVFSILSEEAREALQYCWRANARPEQLPPEGDWWSIWMYLAGRGSGKTRSGAEWINEERKENRRERIALVAGTAADVRDIMVEGDSGILTVLPKLDRPEYEPSKRQLTWKSRTISIPRRVTRIIPRCIAKCYSAEKPDQLRGPQQDLAWADEMAKWAHMQETFDNLLFGLRRGQNPRLFISTTPRPVKLIKELVKDKTCVITVGDTYSNRANLAPTFFEHLIKRYEGTRLGRQELKAEILADNPDALFKREDIDKYRLKYEDVKDIIEQVAVGLDPQGTDTEESADTGIVTVGTGMIKDIEHYFVLADDTISSKPMGWARRSVMAYDLWAANAIVGEVNFGGDMVENTIRTVRWNEDEKYTGGDDVYFEKVRATKGKAIRAEPISALAEQGRWHMVGYFPELEDEMCTWSNSLGERSPNRLDAMVWSGYWLEKNASGSIRFG